VFGPLHAGLALAVVGPLGAALLGGCAAPNADTLYTLVWLDVSIEPWIFSIPDMGDRYYIVPMLDMWADIFASPGWRTTGTQAGDFLVTPRGWTGPVPDGLVRIGAPTPYVWIIGRTKTDGSADYDAVHRIQAGSSAHRPVESAAGDDITEGARQCSTSFLG
jgi:hypothetical protein